MQRIVRHEDGSETKDEHRRKDTKLEYITTKMQAWKRIRHFVEKRNQTLFVLARCIVDEIRENPGRNQVKRNFETRITASGRHIGQVNRFSESN
jgi:hypothetical protein